MKEAHKNNTIKHRLTFYVTMKETVQVNFLTLTEVYDNLSYSILLKTVEKEKYTAQQ